MPGSDSLHASESGDSALDVHGRSSGCKSISHASQRSMVVRRFDCVIFQADIHNDLQDRSIGYLSLTELEGQIYKITCEVFPVNRCDL